MSHTITFEGNDQSFQCDIDDTLLRAALRAGIALPYECNVGACGNCKFELKNGTLSHRSENTPGLRDKDRQKQRFLGCQAMPTSDCHIKVRPQPWVDSVEKPLRQTATLISKTSLTHDLYEFTLKLSEPRAFLAGQYALIYRTPADFPRAYSMSQVASETRLWSFQIKRVPGGQLSNQLIDQSQTGDVLYIDGPYGHAWLRSDSPRNILCLAGGSGLAPMLSIARTVSAQGLGERTLDFVYGGRTPNDLAGENALATLPGFGDRIHYHPVVSDAQAITESGWQGLSGYLHEALAQLPLAELASYEIYFAGPPAMAQALQKTLFDARVSFEQVHFDNFY